MKKFNYSATEFTTFISYKRIFNYVKKISFIYLLIIVLNHNIFGQEIEIRGLLNSVDKQVIIGASIKLNDNLVAVSDINGFFSFKTNYEDTIVLSIKHIGYKSYEHLIQPSKEKKIYNYKFILKQSPFKLNEVTIKNEAVNAFKKKDWVILDFLLIDTNFILLSNEFKGTFLNLFSYSGKLISRTKLSYPYKSLHLSCLGGLHLVGKEYCQEFVIEDEDFYLENIYKKEKFDSLINPCCLIYDKTPIFKDFLEHNQKVVYYSFNDTTKLQQKIFLAYNEVNVNSAKIAYNRIIKEYYRSIANPSMSDISYDFGKENIIEAGYWDGDLLRLAITDSLFIMISNFLNIDSKPIKTNLEEIDGNLFLFDFPNKRILKLKVDGTITSESIIKFNKCKSPEIIKDKKIDKVYLLCGYDEIFDINPRTGRVNFKYSIPSKYLFPKKISINDGKIYFTSYDYSKFSHNKFNRVKIDK